LTYDWHYAEKFDRICAVLRNIVHVRHRDDSMATHDKLELKILVLDAERLIRLTVCARLKKAGYEAVPVATVGEAVALL
jgi:hypothetical protein